jgi:CheY-like chemotaxis protein
MVEDDELQRERLRGWLEGQRWIVQEAQNGPQALASLQAAKPDLILLVDFVRLLTVATRLLDDLLGI